MKVADFMHKPLATVSENEPVRNVVKMIFNLGVSGVPVVKNRKLIGIVTEEDILSKLFPSVTEYMEDFFESSDFYVMEKKLAEVMQKPVSDIMSKNPKTVTPETPLMRAQSLMLLNNISRLLVVNEKKELLSIVSQGDFFRSLVGTEIPYEKAEEFRDWLSRHYDLVAAWEKRLSPEIESLEKLFKKNGVKTFVDIICGTGEHTIALTHKGFKSSGLDRSIHMHRIATRKYIKQPDKYKKSMDFYHGEYITLLKSRKETFDAAILMGNGLPYSPNEWKEILQATKESLTSKGIIIIQIKNLPLIMKKNQRLVEFRTAKSKLSSQVEYAFTMYYGAPNDANQLLTATMSINKFDGRRWAHAGINSIQIAQISPSELKNTLSDIGFKKIELFGSDHGDLLFEQAFDEKRHGWLNVVATY